MVGELSKLRFGRFRFRLRAVTALRLPPYKGSTLRGGFGIAFKEAVCVVDHGDCERCILRTKCAYPYVFETPVPNGSRRMASLEHAPHPFVIEPPLDRRTDYAEGDAFDFDVVLVGRAIDYLPYFIFAFEQLGQRRGIGKALSGRHGAGGERGDRATATENEHERRARSAARGRFTVEAVDVLNGSGASTLAYDGRTKALCNNIEPQTIASAFPRPLGEACPEPGRRSQGEGITREGVLSSIRHPDTQHPTPDTRLTVSFLTPTRLVFDRALATVPEFHIVIRNLLRRLSNLAYFHCDGELDLDFRGLVEAAEQVNLVENRTRWHDWERYSARQDAKLKMGGMVGEAVYEGEVEAFATLLALGEVLHVGKGTGMGLGRYGLEMPGGRQ